MPGRSSFNLKGILNIVGGRMSAEIPITSIIDEVECSRSNTLIPTGGDWTQAPLTFNAGVEEAVFLHLYAPKKLSVRVYDANGDLIELGLKGHWLMCLAPGEGITGLQAKNESTTDNVTLEVTYGSLQDADDEPSYWQE